MSSRIRTGSVVQDKRSKVWNFFWWENGKRKCKVLGRFPTKAAAWKAARPLRDATETKTILTCPRIGELAGIIREGHYERWSMVQNWVVIR